MATMHNLESRDHWIAVAKDNDVPQLALLASKLSTGARGQLLASIEECLVHPEIRAHEHTRVPLAKLLIAMVPDSWAAIRTFIIDRGATRLDGEVRFSLFCFLDDLPRLSAAPALISEAAHLVGDYLRHAESNTASATWMAGDLLGAHWDPREAVPILIDVLTNGRYAEGRLAALHGLEHAIGNADCSGALGQSIIRVISKVASDDRSRRVRESAQRVRNGVSVCGQPGIAKYAPDV
ncbi:MAG: hypothetical protein KJ749_07875 [Planctomycetes bacterium]|nr:hypothetical protein [Planctomycetota bacterium]